MITSARAIAPGASVAVVVAMAGMFLSSHYSAPAMLFALLIGMALHGINQGGHLDAGLTFCARFLLRIGIVLIGARLTFGQIAELGLLPFVLVGIGLASTITLGLLLARLAGKPLSFGLLTGGAVGICGASAALAISSVLPRGEKGIEERDIAFTIIAVTALGTLAMILYPMAAAYMGFDARATGLFLGATIHDVAQTVGAGYAVSVQTGDTATLVKLLRVASLLPVVLIIYLLVARAAKGETRLRTGFPLFLIGFAVMVSISSTGLVNMAILDACSQASRWALLIAIASIGIRTNVAEFTKIGGAAFAIILMETVWIAVCAIGLLFLLN